MANRHALRVSGSDSYASLFLFREIFFRDDDDDDDAGISRSQYLTDSAVIIVELQNMT